MSNRSRFGAFLHRLPWKKVHVFLEWVRAKVQPRIDGALGRLDFEEPALAHSFLADAEYCLVQQEPVRARLLVRLMLWSILAFIVLAAIIHVDEITKGEGKVIPSLQLQVLQSLDGGIVSQIAVREGDAVLAGQLLVQIDSTRFMSSAREGQAQYLSLLARAARLRALAEGRAFDPPAEALKEKPEIVEEERRLYESRASELEAQVSIARQQLLQRNQELLDVKARKEQSSQAYDLAIRELNVTKPLISSGAVSEVDLLRLERDVARYRGERDSAIAQIARVQAAITEAQRKIQEVELNFRNESRKEMAEVLGRLEALSENRVGLDDKVKHSAIRSPVKGTVKRLLVNTVGGVIQPGRDIVEVVPSEDTLLLEAKVSPRDIAFLRPGLKAVVKLSAYDFAVYGALDGKLEHIGADSITDEKGNTYYLVRIRTDRASLGPNLPVIPGMMAEVDIVTGQKSLLSYLLRPVVRAKQNAFTER